MAKMMNTETMRVLNVVEHIIITNLWEYYVIQDPDHPEADDDLLFCLVLGFEQEFGYVSKDEIQGHIVSRTKSLNEILPAPGYMWVA